MQIIIIVATDKNGAIGYKNKLPWHFKKDLQFFKKKTINHFCLVGRKTFVEIGVLPKRKFIVLTNNSKYKCEHVHVKRSVRDAVSFAQKLKIDKLFIIGGGEIYKQTIDIANCVYHTLIDVELNNADAYFPIDIFKKMQLANERVVYENNVKLSFRKYVK